MEKQSTNLQNKIEIRNSFSIRHTLECGQIFRYFKVKNCYYVPYRNSILKLKEEKNYLSYEVYGAFVNSLEILNFIGLNHPVDSINRDLIRRDRRIAPMIEFSRGLRIVKTPPYETVISFIFSIQNSIPVISRKLNLLSEIVGKVIEVDGERFYLFPGSDDLRRLSDKDYSFLKLGYRERYFREFVERFKENDLDCMSGKSFEKKRELLLSINGVGEKVAQCVLLFGFGELSAFPVDVWIRRGLEKYFHVKGTLRKLSEYGRKKFGKFAGYAQEYIYFYVRNDSQ